MAGRVRPAWRSNSPALTRTAAVVRDRRHVLDRLDVDADRLNGADGGLASGSRSLHHHVDRAHALILGGAGGVLGRDLRGERRSLAGALEADASGRRPGEHVALGVGDRDDRVVEGRLDVRHSVRNRTALLLLARLLVLLYGRCGCCSHWRLSEWPAVKGRPRDHYFLVSFFLPATAPLRGPLRVRAFVFVRCPRTGRPLRWRTPR